MDMALAHVSNWVVNPLGDQVGEAWLFATHPPLSDRIDWLLSVKHEPMTI
jgi:Zn-dependent protease with chaperone function